MDDRFLRILKISCLHMSKDEDYIKSNMTILYAKCDFLSVNVSSVNKGIIFLELLK